MTKDANDIHRELGTDAARALADSLPDIPFATEEAPKASRGNGLVAAGEPSAQLLVGSRSPQK
jgi:hypothetical protein